MIKVFIDGSSGTTGLRIKSRLMKRDDTELIVLPEEQRHSISSRGEAINNSDVTFLCLPDAEALTAVSLCNNSHTVIIDASTAHRTNPDFAYGFPELSKEHKNRIKLSKKISNPGCHATGFCAIIYPLIKNNVISPDYPVVAHSLTGYSGGGKKMIAEYENAERDIKYDSPCEYALSAAHKHLPEMKAVCGLSHEPAFNPIVADFYSGMMVCFPLTLRLAEKKITAAEIRELYAGHYENKGLIKVMPYMPKGTDDGMLYAGALSGTDGMIITVCGSDETVNVYASFCNLGKGASGAAIQNMNIAMGVDETKGLVIL